jgi:hypothetical protein
MSTHTRKRVATTVCVLVLAAFSANALGAQTPGSTDARWKGIKVHGHWTIDIKNADGSLERRNEFENALVDDGVLMLVNILARRWNAAGWAVELVGAAQSVFLTEAARDLTVSVPTSGPNLGKLVLEGSLTSPVAETYTRVISRVRFCPPGANCIPNSVPPSFTAKDLPPIAVQAGQIVQVTVVISFS